MLPLAGNAYTDLCCSLYIYFRTICTLLPPFAALIFRFSNTHNKGTSLSFFNQSLKIEGMSFIWEASPLWRTIVRSTRDSRPLFFTFIATTIGASTLLWYGTQQFTNPDNLDEKAVAKLRAKSGLDARVVSEVNKQRLGVLLKEVSQRDGASLDKQEKRWRDALDGRTTGDADGTTKRQFGWKRRERGRTNQE